MIRYGVPSWTPESWSVTTLGWLSRAAASASSLSGLASFSRVLVRPGRMALKATARDSSRSLASKTSPKPPRPSSRTSSKRPATTSPGRSSGSSSSGAREGAEASSLSSDEMDVEGSRAFKAAPLSVPPRPASP